MDLEYLLYLSHILNNALQLFCCFLLGHKFCYKKGDSFRTFLPLVINKIGDVQDWKSPVVVLLPFLNIPQCHIEIDLLLLACPQPIHQCVGSGLAHQPRRTSYVSTQSVHLQKCRDVDRYPYPHILVLQHIFLGSSDHSYLQVLVFVQQNFISQQLLLHFGQKIKEKVIVFYFFLFLVNILQRYLLWSLLGFGYLKRGKTLIFFWFQPQRMFLWYFQVVWVHVYCLGFRLFFDRWKTQNTHILDWRLNMLLLQPRLMYLCTFLGGIVLTELKNRSNSIIKSNRYPDVTLTTLPKYIVPVLRIYHTLYTLLLSYFLHRYTCAFDFIVAVIVRIVIDINWTCQSSLYLEKILHRLSHLFHLAFLKVKI